MIELWQTLSEQQAVIILVPIGVAVLVTALCLVVWKFLYRWLARWAKKANVELFDIVLRSTRSTLLSLCFVAGIYAGIRVSKLPEAWMGAADKLMLSLLIMAIALAVASLASLGIASYARRSRIAMPMTSLAQNVVRGLILLLGVLILLDTLGVKITSLIAALGIGSLAVALALQATLSNLFAGAYIILSRNIRTGDFIKVESDVEGYVVDIGWRSTRLRTPFNNLVIIPNSKLGESVITNYYAPSMEIGVMVTAGVSYSSNLDQVERVARAAAQEVIQDLDEAVKTFEPWFGYEEFGESNINFWVWMQAKDRLASFRLKSELIKRLKARFDQEGITINYPVRTTYLHLVNGRPPSLSRGAPTSGGSEENR